MFHSSIYGALTPCVLTFLAQKKHAIGELTFTAGRDRIMMFYRNTNSGDQRIARDSAIIYK
jgi:hypothetical protein